MHCQVESGGVCEASSPASGSGVRAISLALLIGLAAALLGAPARAQPPAPASPPLAAGPILASVTGAPPLPLVTTKLKSPVPLVGVSAVTGDRQGRIYVLHRPPSGDPVVVLDRSGHLVRSFGAGRFAIPHGIRLDPDGNVWTVDAHTSVVLKFSPDGRQRLRIEVGGVPDPNRDFCGASDIAFAPGGHVFVSDGYCNGRVVEYDAAGAEVRAWGRLGREPGPAVYTRRAPGKLNIAHGIARAANGDLLVADRWNGRIQRFRPDGTLVSAWTYGGELYAVAFDPQGRLYATVHDPAVPNTAGWTLIQVDPSDGAVLGQAPIPGGHELAIAPDGAILPATRSEELVLLRRK